jgi:hypothetical protein
VLVIEPNLPSAHQGRDHLTSADIRSAQRTIAAKKRCRSFDKTDHRHFNGFVRWPQQPLHKGVLFGFGTPS